MNKKGFTLIELLIVVAIIGILAIIAIPAYVGQQTRAARSEAFSNLQNLQLLEAQYFADQGTYTPSLGTTGANQPNNVNTIQTGAGVPANGLPGFQPGPGLSYSYAIINNTGQGLPTPVPLPYDGTLAALPSATTPCFIATATGNTGSRVSSDEFAIDCNNNRNF
jgi:prepilin-type N-terminal cleavage/methylation domain-containing protein